MTEMSTFERAIGHLRTGYVTKYHHNKYNCSCNALGLAEGRRIDKDCRGPMEEYARSWFANQFEASGDYLEYNHYPEVFSDDPGTARRARIKQQYNRALWLTLLDLLHTEGQTP